MSDTTEEEMLPLFGEFEEIASDKLKDEVYEAPLISDEIEDVKDIESSRRRQILEEDVLEEELEMKTRRCS